MQSVHRHGHHSPAESLRNCNGNKVQQSGLHAAESLHPEEAIQVHILQDSLVKPLTPTKRHVMYMSVMDQVLGHARPARTILFYRTAQDAAVAAESLRAAIASALVPYYPMAGRLVRQADGRLAIDCNDAGVQLLLARCSLSFAELECNGFEMQPVFRRLVAMDDRQHSNSLDDPFASFQVTSFQGGGIAVGIAVLHSVVDGHSEWTFIRAISEACRGVPLSDHQPLHTRTLLKPEVFMMGATFPDVDVQGQLIGAADGLHANNGREETVPKSNPDPELLHQKVIHFSQEMLETLKKACRASSTNCEEGATKPGFFVSSYQALGAYMWKRLTLAQSFDDDMVVYFYVIADLRSRMIPPLTPAFFGNAVLGIPTRATAGNIVRESLGDIAARLRQTISKGNDMYIKKTLTAMERTDLSREVQSTVNVIVVRNAITFPSFEAGNLGWGEAEAVRVPWEVREGQFSWYRGKKGKSIDVMVALSDATYDRFFFSEDLYPNDPLAPFFFPNTN